jgi:mevalonate kinase
MKKAIGLILLFIIILASAGYYYVFVYAKNHHRDIQAEQSIVVEADSLSVAFGADEAKANATYLNKAIQVTGAILSIDKNQAGQTTLLVGDKAAFSNVSITLTTPLPSKYGVGSTITVKGVCTGALSDVVVTDGVIQ